MGVEGKGHESFGVVVLFARVFPLRLDCVLLLFVGRVAAASVARRCFFRVGHKRLFDGSATIGTKIPSSCPLNFRLVAFAMDLPLAHMVSIDKVQRTFSSPILHI